MSDAVNPDHYKRLPAEAIEIIESAIQGAPSVEAAYLHGQVLKYILRCWSKNGIEDLKKAKWYLDRLISLADESEQQKAAEPQSLPAMPIDGRRNSDKIPQGYRKLKDSSEEPRKLGDLRWSISQKRYVEIGEEEIGYANRDNWAACRKIETPSNEPIDEPNQDDHPHDFKVGDAVISWQGREGVIEAINLIDDFPITVRHSIREQVSYKLGGVKKKHDDHAGVKPVVKQSLTTEPPDGWRWLEVGEVIRNGDQGFEKGLFYAIDSLIGMELQAHWKPIIRRNRFEVGEKVVRISNGVVYKVIRILSMGYQLESEFCAEVILHGKDLAPYIEATE
jgi:hypothetical protein